MDHKNFEDQLKNPKFKNWVKGGLAFKNLCDGIVDIIKVVVDEDYQLMIRGLLVPDGFECNHCSLHESCKKDSNKCPQDNIDCRCLTADSTCVTIRGKQCPKDMCHKIVNWITQCCPVEFSKPVWKNSDIKKWFDKSDGPWALAKCFIHSPGYGNKEKITDVDVSGLLSLLSGNLHYRDHFSNPKMVEIMGRLREHRNFFCHDANFELEKSKLTDIINDAMTVLKDDKKIKNTESSKQSVLNMTALQTEAFTITSDASVEIVLEYKQFIEQEMKEIKIAVLELSRNSNEYKQLLDKIPELWETRSSDIIKRTIDHVISQPKESQQEEIELLKERVTKLEELHKIQDRCDMFLNAQQIKKDFQHQLIDLYEKHVINVSPILLQPERASTPIDSIYVKPWLTLSHDDKRDKASEATSISSYKDIFVINGKTAKLIYILGEPGTGKSFFCVKMVSDWCKATKSQGVEVDENLVAMKNFEFLFYIILRHNTDQNDIELMLQQQYDDQVSTILDIDSSNCLILLDGLDEWAASPVQPSSQFQTRGLPVRHLKRKYTLISTSRPWKVETLGLRPHEIDLKLQLKGVDDEGKLKLARNIYDLNKESRKVEKTFEEFLQALAKCPLTDMHHVPFVLHQLGCLWFDGKDITSSYCQILSDMLSLFVEWAILRSPGGNLEAASDISCSFCLPQQIRETITSNRLGYVFSHICELAYKTLFSETKESILVFGKNLLHDLRIPQDIVNKCISLGIISEAHLVGLKKSVRSQSSYNFVHISMQEYLAAVYSFSEISRRLEEVRGTDSVEQQLKIIKDVLSGYKTVADILQKANIIVLLCGFNPALSPAISALVYDIAVNDTKLIEMRLNSGGESANSVQLITCFNEDRSGRDMATANKLQRLLSRCFSESLQGTQSLLEKKLKLADLDLADIFNQIKDLNHLLPHVQFDGLLSLKVRCNVMNLELISVLHNLFPEVDCKLSTLVIEVKLISYGSEKVSTIMDRSKSTLVRFAVKLTIQPFQHTEFHPDFCHAIMQALPEMHNLQVIELQQIYLQVKDCVLLSLFLQKATYLRQITLRSIVSKTRRPLKCSLVEHNHLEMLAYEKVHKCFEFQTFNTSSIRTIRISPLNNFLESTLQNLASAMQLRNIYMDRDIESFLTDLDVTKLLTTLLPQLPVLETLVLHKFRFSENILQYPMEMKCLKKIGLTFSSFLPEIWKEFLDKVVEIPQNVLLLSKLDCSFSDGKFIDTNDSEMFVDFFRSHPKFQDFLQFKSMETLNGFVVSFLTSFKQEGFQFDT